MELNSTAVAIAGLVGLITGAFAVLAFHFSERERRGARPAPPSFDEGVAAVLAALESATIIVDGADRVVRASATAHALGLVRSGALAHDRLAELVTAARDNGEILTGQIDVPRGLKGGGVFHLDVRAAPLAGEEILVLAEDRTESRRLEDTRRDLVANVSHELKTPVGAIALLAETLQDSADDAQAVRRFAGRIEAESRRLGTLVQDIIEFSRLQDQDVFEHPRLVAIDEVVARALDGVETGAASRGIAFDTHVEPGLEVYGDADLLATAVRNLLENAVNYSPEHSEVFVRVRTKANKVAIDVIDHGIGIARPDVERVFERFYRADPARSRLTGGTGLGLSIVKHVAANHGGQVKLRSKVGEGSVFTLELPRRDETSGDGAAAPLEARDQ